MNGGTTLQPELTGPSSWTWIARRDGVELARQAIDIAPDGPAAALLEHVARYVTLLRDPADPTSEMRARLSVRTLVRDWLLGAVAPALDHAPGPIDVHLVHGHCSAQVPIELGLDDALRARIVYRVDRSRAASGPAVGHQRSAPTSVLAVFPSPRDLPELRTHVEHAELRCVVAPTRRYVPLRYGVDCEAVRSAITAGCDVLHVAAHGAPGGLYLDSSDGCGAVLEAEELVRWCQEARHRPLLVVLACCESAASSLLRDAPASTIDRLGIPRRSEQVVISRATMAPALALARAGFPVVGMRYPVTDAFARAFAAALLGRVHADTPMAECVDAVASARWEAMRGESAASVLDAGAVMIVGPVGDWPSRPPAAPATAPPNGDRPLEGRRQELSDGICALRRGDSVLLWGPPGVGLRACQRDLLAAAADDPLVDADLARVNISDRPAGLGPQRSIMISPLRSEHLLFAAIDRRDRLQVEADTQAAVISSRGLPAALAYALEGHDDRLADVVGAYDRWLDDHLDQLADANRELLVALAALEPVDRTHLIVAAVAPNLVSGSDDDRLRALVHGTGTDDDRWWLDSRTAEQARARDVPRTAEVRAAVARFWTATADAAGDADFSQAALRALPYLDDEQAAALTVRILNRDRSPTTARTLLPTIERLVFGAEDIVQRTNLLMARDMALRLSGQAGLEDEIRAAIDDAEARRDHRSAARLMTRLVQQLMLSGRHDDALVANRRRADNAQRAHLGPVTQIAIRGEELDILARRPDQACRVLEQVPRLLLELDAADERSGADEIADAGQTRQSLLGLGWRAAVTMRDWSSALDFNQRRLAAKVARGASERELRLTRFNAIDAMIEHGMLVDAQRLLADLKAGFEADQDWGMTGQALMSSAVIHEEHGRLDEAEHLLRRALSYAYLEARRPDVCAVAHNNLAEIVERRGASVADLPAQRLAALLLLVALDDPGAHGALDAWRSARPATVAGADLESLANSTGYPVFRLLRTLGDAATRRATDAALSR